MKLKNILNIKKLAALLVLVGAAPASSATAAVWPVDIQINYSGDPGYQKYFDVAEYTWERVLGGYKSAPTPGFSGPVIHASVADTANSSGGVSTTSSFGGYTYSASGQMILASGVGGGNNGDQFSRIIAHTIVHEIGHALGFGLLWPQNGLYNSAENPGVYQGANALAMYRHEFGVPDATHVPVETEGGGGTANYHWDEPIGGGVGGLTRDYANDPDLGLQFDASHPVFGAIFQASVAAGGPDNYLLQPLDANTTERGFYGDILTGWIGVGPTHMSYTTMASFEDLGYTVSLLNAIPEPNAALLVGLLGGCALLRRRR
jgi:hypothetical protein